MGLLEKATGIKRGGETVSGENLPDIDTEILNPDDLVEINSVSAPVSDIDVLSSESSGIDSGVDDAGKSILDEIDNEIPGIDPGVSSEIEELPDFGVSAVDAESITSGKEDDTLKGEISTDTIDVTPIQEEDILNDDTLSVDQPSIETDAIDTTEEVSEESLMNEESGINIDDRQESVISDDGMMHDLEDLDKTVSTIDTDEIDSMLDLDTVEDNAAKSTVISNEKIISSKEEDEIPPVRETAEDDKASPNIKEVLSDMSLPHDEGELSSVLWDSTSELIHARSQQDLFNMLLLLVMGQTGANAVSVLTPLKGEDNKWGITETRGARLRSKMITFKGSDPIMNAALSGKRFVDIEEFAGTPECRDEYPLFNSISGRFIYPLVVDDGTGAILAIGEKISGEEYLPQEKAFLLKTAEIAGNLLSYINLIESLGEENKSFIARNKEYSDIETLERDFRRSFITESAAISIAEKMNFYGAESFAFFSRTERGNMFQVKFTEKEDICSFRESAFTIPVESEFCSHLVQHDEWEEFEHPASSRVLRSVFSDAQILRMNICVVYPFVLRGFLAGFLVVTRAKRERLDECRVHAMRLARTVFSIIQQGESILVEEGVFIDSVSRISGRMDRTVRDAAALRIPVTFVQFSVKNFKRYISLFGEEDAEKLMETFRIVVESRISGSEYAVRMERNRIMTVLPGKSRKYAMPFASAVRNELVSHFSERESQILISFLIAEYPSDGKSLCDILEYLD